MSTTVPRTVARAPERVAVTTMARYEAFRLARHPVFLVGVALMLLITATYWTDGAYGDADYDLTGPSPNTSLDTPIAPAFLIGLLGLVAMNRITTSAGRTGEALDAVPVTEPRRTLALCLACLLPFALGVAFTAYVGFVWAVDPPVYALGWDEYSAVDRAAYLASGALACLGGPLVGVLVARWWRWPTAGAVTAVLLIMWSALSLMADRTELLSFVHMSAPFSVVTGYGDTGHHWHQGGDLVLRLGYLAGLCLLAALVACAHGTEGATRRPLARAVVVTSVVTVALLVLSVLVGPDGYEVADPTWPLR